MNTSVKSLVSKYKEWFIVAATGLIVALWINKPTSRHISQSYLRGLINKQEVADITIRKNRLSIPEEYSAEITLTPTAIKRYEQHGVTFPSPKISPHFITYAGSSADEVDRWERLVNNISMRPLAIKKSY